MKKSVCFLGLIMVLSILSIFGCSKSGVSSEIAAGYLVDSFIYCKDNEALTEAFANSTVIRKIASKEELSLRKDLGIEASKEGDFVDITEAESQAVADFFKKVVREKSEYSVSIIEENNDKAVVKVSIKGFDYMSTIASNAESMKQLFSLGAPLEPEALGKLISENAIKALGEGRIMTQAQDVTITLFKDKKDEGKWYLDSEANDQALKDMYRLFFLGTTSMKALEKASEQQYQ